MKYIIPALAAFYLLLSNACNAQQPTMQLQPAKGIVVMILDSSDASKAIVFDQRDKFFEKVTTGEMSIQMKKPLDAARSRETVLQEYKAFLKSDVMSFTADEVKFLNGVIDKMYKTASSVAAGIFPDTLKLIKTKGTHYGDGVWYTRENCIIIPLNELVSRKTNPFTSTMYHELFHVYSRLNPAKSAELYKLIGFEAIGYENLRVPPGLAERILFNPDGVDYAQRIDLQQDDKTVVSAVPVIYSNHVGYKEGNTEFFSYLEFTLYPVEKQADGKWMIKVQDDGFSSSLRMDSQPSFFSQIKDNTGYIIHPDEVLADNFSFIMQELNGAKISMKFSPAGKQLLKDIEAILKKK